MICAEISTKSFEIACENCKIIAPKFLKSSAFQIIKIKIIW